MRSAENELGQTTGKICGIISGWFQMLERICGPKVDFVWTVGGGFDNESG